MRSILAYERRLALSRAILSANPDIIALTDTWLTENIADAEINLPNYSLIRKERTTNRELSKHGGVLLGVKNIRCKTLNLSQFCENTDDFAACKIDSPGYSYIMGVLYNPPTTSNYRWPLNKWSNFLAALDRFMRDEHSQCVILMGDINLPGVNWSSFHSNNDYESDVLRLLDKYNLTQLVNFNTTSSNTLDVVLASNDSLILSVCADETLMNLYSVNDRMLSDHKPMCIKLQFRSLTTLAPIKKRSYSLADYEKLT